MPAEGTETVEVYRAGGPPDRYGQTPPGTLVATLRDCIVWPRASSDRSDRGITTTEGHNIWVPDGRVTWSESVPVPDREIKPSDEVWVRGSKEAIDGQVGDWRKKNGMRKGYLFETKTWAPS